MIIFKNIFNKKNSNLKQTKKTWQVDITKIVDLIESRN